MKTLTTQIKLSRTSIMIVAACLSLGMSSCGTTSGNVASRSQNLSSVCKRAADTSLEAVAVPLGAVGWGMTQALIAMAYVFGGGY
jgi:hypothetical protein